MRLRTTAGAYAGQVRDYPYPVAVAALATGTAEAIEEIAPVTPSSDPPRVTRVDESSRRGSRRFR